MNVRMKGWGLLQRPVNPVPPEKLVPGTKVIVTFSTQAPSEATIVGELDGGFITVEQETERGQPYRWDALAYMLVLPEEASE